MYIYLYFGEVSDVYIVDFTLPRVFMYLYMIFSRGLLLNFYESRWMLEISTTPPLNSPYAVSTFYAFFPQLICTRGERKKKNTKPRDTGYDNLSLSRVNHVLKASRVNRRLADLLFWSGELRS